MPTLALLAALMVPTADLPDDPPPPKRAIPPAGVQLSQMVQLRHAAAADAARSVTKFLQGNGQQATITYDPATNTVSVAASAAVREQVVSLLGAIDTLRPHVRIEAVMMRVPTGFLAGIGLTDDTPGTPVLTLTPRELNVLNTQIRHAKASEAVDILTRSQPFVADNQSGFVMVGQNFPYLKPSRTDEGTSARTIEYRWVGLSLRVTPRINPDGKVLMRVEPSVYSVSLSPTGVGNGEVVPAFSTQTTQTTVLAADGQTVVLHGLMVTSAALSPDDGPITALLKWAAGTRSEIMIVLTPHLVAPEKAKPPAKGWFGTLSPGARIFPDQ